MIGRRHGRRARFLAVTALAGAALLLAGCTATASETHPGLLDAKDMPFEATHAGDIDRPDILTQLGSQSCLGIEQGVLYDAGWRVAARDFYNSTEDWHVQSAEFTPKTQGDAAGLTKVASAATDCIGRSTDVDVETLTLADGEYGYLVRAADGSFDAARGYRSLSDGRLAQVSITKMPADAGDPGDVLERLLEKTS
ncbi:hypothetical protein [Microbacterium luticocti]|uniref:hypothetical protein n=1 Tax=Microbacterium luticocti TaxID=451764 RepID=UPI0003F58868|nr:hypothetical protein [Microbacterium luticocti]